MAKAEKRNLKQIGKQWCQQYMSEVTLFIEPQAPSGRRLVAQYEEGSYKDAPEFAAGIPDDWTEKDILRFIDLPGSKKFPAWEIPARVHGSAVLMWPSRTA